MKSKIHKAIITEVCSDHIDSITIDEELMERSNIKEYEKVMVVSNTSGARLETFVVRGKRGSGVISMNGTAAFHIEKGHEVTIMAFTWSVDDIKPHVILVDEKNSFLRCIEEGQVYETINA